MSDSFLRDFFGLSDATAARMREVCCERCGIVFAVPVAYFEERQRSGSALYCPNAHGLSIKPPKT